MSSTFSSRKSLKKGLCALTLAGTVALPLMPLQASIAAPASSASPAVVYTADQAQHDNVISWGIRGSFTGYIGMPKVIKDGATHTGDARNGQFHFEAEDAVIEGDTVKLQGKGTIQYLGHSSNPSNPDDIDAYALNLTMKNPRIELNTKTGTGYVYMTVDSRQYPSGDWAHLGEVKFATLNSSAATQSEKDGVITWEKIAANLTADAVPAFSNFYKENEGLEPLTFSYKGSATNAASDSYTLKESTNTGIDYTDTNNFYDAGDKIIHVHTSPWGFGDTEYTVYSSDLKKLYTGTLNAVRAHVAVNPATGDIAYVDKDSRRLTIAHIGDSSIEKPVENLKADLMGKGEVHALGYSPVTNTWAALASNSDGIATYVTVNAASGEATSTQFDSPRDFDSKVKNAGSLEGYYGDTNSVESTKLVPLYDGTFVYATGASIYDADEELLQKGALLHIKDNTVRVVTEIEPSDGGTGQSLKGILATNDGTIYRWDSFYKSAAFTQTLKYSNGTFSIIEDTKNRGTFSEVSSFFTVNGQVVVVDAGNGRLAWVDEHLNVTKELPVSNLTKTNRDSYLAFTRSNGDIIFPTTVENLANYTTEVWINRLAAPASVTPKPVEPVTPEPEANAQLSVTQDGTIDPENPAKITVKGTGYYGEAAKQGVYVYITTERNYPAYSVDLREVSFAQYIPASQIKDGAFEVELTIPGNRLQAGGKYVVATGATGKAEGETDVLARNVLAASQPIAVAPIKANPLITIGNVDLNPALDENVISVIGSGFVGADKTGLSWEIYEAADENGTPTGEALAEGDIDALDINSAGSFEDAMVYVAGKRIQYGKKYVLVVHNRDLRAIRVLDVVEEPAKEANPAISLSTNEELDASVPNKLTVKGTGYYGEAAQHGVFVYIAEKGSFPAYTADERVLPLVLFVKPDQIKDGSFEVELNIPADRLNPTKSYVVATGATGKDFSETQNLTRGLLETSQPISLKPAPKANPALSANTTTADPAVKDNQFLITGTGFTGVSKGINVGIYELDANGNPSASALVEEDVYASDINASGGFSVALSVAGTRLDYSKQYVIIARSFDKSLEAKVDLTTATKPAVKQYFVDVPPTNVFYTEIQWLAEKGITTGWSDGTYRPTEKIERGAMAAYFYRMAGSPDVNLPATSPFKDVDPSFPFYKEIVWMHQQGITTGWADGTFRPHDAVNRDATAAFFYRYAKVTGYTAPASSHFSDVKPGDMFYTEISWLESTGITRGWDDGTFRPVEGVQRDAMAAFMYRYDKNVKK